MLRTGLRMAATSSYQTSKTLRADLLSACLVFSALTLSFQQASAENTSSPSLMPVLLCLAFFDRGSDVMILGEKEHTEGCCSRWVARRIVGL